MFLNFSLLDKRELNFNTDKKVVTIGRSKQCDIILPIEGISRVHLKIEINDEAIIVTDLNSLNGVFIEGERLEPNTPTNYRPYLTLSFGPVISVQISHETRTSGQIPEALIETNVTSELTQTKMLIRPHSPNRAKRASKNENQRSSKTAEDKVVNFLLALIGVLTVVYFLTLK